MNITCRHSCRLVFALFVVLGCNNEQSSIRLQLIYDDFLLTHGRRINVKDLPFVTSVVFIQDDSGTGENSNDDSDMVQLADMPQLRHLSVNQTQVSSAGLAVLENLTNLETFDAGITSIDDRTLKHLTNSRGLKTLLLFETLITNEGVEYIATHFSSLEMLDLSSTAVDDVAIRSLVKFPRLVRLNLAGTRITDASIPVLAQMKQLQVELNITDTPVSDAGVEELRRALPNIKIYY